MHIPRRNVGTLGKGKQMKVVWKFLLDLKDYANPRFELTMPRDARILTVQMQAGIPCLWAEVYPDNPVEVRRFAIVSTGCPVPPGVSYIGTWQDGPFVWHLYEGPRG